ncbi:MAG TPA: carbon-nitrogen hydrolase family protein [Candidatus Thermoplasmatota archaeon]|nr:carbon-nitrogen hydrolase family protein [Candidatus Thermoplasmatota archaeon]
MGSFRAALHQFAPAIADKKANLAAFERAVRRTRADLHVFPELSLTGYFARDLLRTLAEPLDGPSVQRVRAIARRSGAHVLFGMPRASEIRGVVHNAAVLVAPDGETWHYDKIHLPTFSVFEEGLYFGPGRETVVAKTGLGRLGLCICYDLFFPEVTKTLALSGADVLACISASPNISRRYFEAVLPARAVETTSWLLFCNIAGMQDQVDFWGGSRVHGPRGDERAKAPLFEAADVTETVDLAELDVARNRRPVLRDTRRDLFGSLPAPSSLPKRAARRSRARRAR